MKKLLFILLFLPVVGKAQFGSWTCQNLGNFINCMNFLGPAFNTEYGHLYDSMRLVLNESDTGKIGNMAFWGKTTTDLTEGNNLYFTNARARNAFSVTTTGSGAATYNPTTGVLNVPTPSAGGSVTSVGISSSDLSVSGSPVTTSGNITLSLATSGVVAGTYGAVTVTNKGIVTSGKRLELYSGTTNSSGVYTVTFGTPYSVAPNIQASITNQSNTNQFIRVSSVSTTGFTINVFQRNSVTLLSIEVLLAATVNVNGATVDVLVTEK